jgi:predicted house-cleaning noncanonical NTP pyrophosphatase (MazG superfamily)
MVSDDKVLKALHKVVNEELSSDMSQERLADIYEVVQKI